MADRERVIKALEVCIPLDEGENCPTECPYYQDVCSGYSQVMRDALELLKEQEARVMTLDEVKAFDWDYCYLEEERLPGKEYRTVCGDYALTCITWPGVASMRIQHGDNSYGKKWRCWTSKPTSEQRTAVKWE